MTNKPMLSVERDLIERAVQAIINTSQMQPALNELHALLDKPDECRCKRYGKDNPHWPCPVHADPAAQHQGEPVAICRLWNEGGSGERTSVEFINGPCADGTLLYAEQPAPVAVVMPDLNKIVLRRALEIPAGYTLDGSMKYELQIWQAALAEVARLNGVKP